MNDALQQVISDAEIEEKHWGNWGSMTPREVVNEGVLRYAHGFSSGYTQMQILLSHKLLKKPKTGSYRADLTQKGKAYARALWNRRADLPATRAQIMASPEVRALVEAFEKATAQLEKAHDDAFKQAIGHGLQTTDGRPFSCMELNICSDVANESRAALAAFNAMEAGE